MTEIKMDISLLKRYHLFAGFSDAEIEEIIALLGGCLLKFEKGDCLNSLMDRRCPKTLACILSGWALLIKYDAQGNQAILDFAMPGYLLGCYSVLTSMDFRGLRVDATSPGLMLCLRSEPLLSADGAACWPLLAKLGKNVMTQLAERSWRLLKKAEILSRHSLRERILSFLDSQRELCHSDSFEIPLDRQELADYLYVNRSALSRELGKLKEEGLIDFHRSKFKLLFQNHYYC